MFVFLVYIASLFVRRKFQDYEPPLSVVIPVYNEEKNISHCLDAVFASDYPKNKLEVIVVDDGSTDKTAEIVRKYPVRFLSQHHKGKSEALTLGAKTASHEFVLAIDADTTIEKDCIKEIVKPLADQSIGATTGASKVKNMNALLGWFQNIEYLYNNLIRNSFSLVFNNGIWFFGAIACYRKSVLEKVGYFKTHTLTEDMDIALEIKKAGYKTYNVKDALGKTVVPSTLSSFYKQRSRWWMGVLQALVKNKELFSLKSSPSILFLYINQFWWSFYAFLSFPLIIYQINYWLPYNSETFMSLSSYLFRWFTLSGPLYVIYKIPEWGLSYYSLFGVMAGIISAFLITASFMLFKDARFKNLFALFFYFPYTIVLNMITFISLLNFKRLKTRFFLK
jgi:cellulose synthase/poly-beta-1,6-N-acetylglucosamine synthase-like glycosyltransferase